MRASFIVSLIAALIVGAVGGSLTDIGPWYRALEKSPLNPPDWAFGPAWTTIYALCVAAATFGWRAARSGAEKSLLIALFAVNAGLNIAWTALFFAMRRPDWALIEVAALWLSVLALIVFFSRFSRLSALALLPYLVWVAFAAVLNYGVVRLNGPFGS